LENRKLIASRDVHFFEDNSPSDLAIVDIGTKITPLTGINDLVDNAIAKDKGFSTILSHHELTSDVSEFIPMSTDPAQPTTPVNNTNDNDPPIPPPVPRKALKWENLPKRDPSSRTRKPPEQYAPATTGNNITTSGSTNFAFITVANEPHSYEEAIHSPHLKQWESTIESEFCQLQKAGVFE